MRVATTILFFFILAFDITIPISGKSYTFNISSCFGQNQPMTVGFQLKPIFRNEFFNAGNVSHVENNVSYTVDPRVGFAGGMIIRSDFGKRFSFETGINYIRRNFTLSVVDLDSSFKESMNFGVLEYEIPLSFLVYVRLGERVYMNNSVGISLNMFKRSDKDHEYQGDYIEYDFTRSTWLIPGLIANLGWEYRASRAGSFYFGSSYQLPFDKILTMTVTYKKRPTTEFVDYKLSLGYFTFDFKYFFPVNSEK